LFFNNAREGNKFTVVSTYQAGKPTGGNKIAPSQHETLQYAYKELRPFLVDPYKQALIDLQYFEQEIQLQDLQHVVIVLIDANQDEHQKYRDQGYTTQCVLV
jgi:hypothetical protein